MISTVGVLNYRDSCKVSNPKGKRNVVGGKVIGLAAGLLIANKLFRRDSNNCPG
jgi:hypothetical protein